MEFTDKLTQVFLWGKQGNGFILNICSSSVNWGPTFGVTQSIIENPHPERGICCKVRVKFSIRPRWWFGSSFSRFGRIWRRGLHWISWAWHRVWPIQREFSSVYCEILDAEGETKRLEVEKQTANRKRYEKVVRQVVNQSPEQFLIYAIHSTALCKRQTHRQEYPVLWHQPTWFRCSSYDWNDGWVHFQRFFFHLIFVFPLFVVLLILFVTICRAIGWRGKKVPPFRFAFRQAKCKKCRL